ncbi:hypothetical protein [Paracoccus shanxieyensis]|uniref:hypothetical protein n=1 Tax=Paracoccus shanxieyensis TaxID=2675752 RepID=UPI001E3B0670|nr:hypothetical protein [Paracoccus shanxieyensis]
MGGYTQRVRDSILPLSVAGTLPAAFNEWSFTDNTVDHEQPIETCELCGQQDLRYHFEIANHYTDATLWVGSHCILQFDVAVIEKGRRLSPAEAKRHLTKLTQQMHLESCIRTLEQLAAKERRTRSCRALWITIARTRSSPPNTLPSSSGSFRLSTSIITRRSFRSSFAAPNISTI